MNHLEAARPSLFDDESLAGHLLLTPSIFLGRSIQRIFSSLETKTPCAALSEIVTRVFLAFIVLICAIPALALVPLGLLFKAISRSCTQKAPPQERPPVKEKTTVKEKSGAKERPREFTQQPKEVKIETKETPAKPAKALTESKPFSIHPEGLIIEIPYDGNCAYEALWRGLMKEGIQHLPESIVDLRNQTSDWIASFWKEGEVKFSLLLQESMLSYYEEKLQGLALEEEQVTSALAQEQTPLDQKNYCQTRLTSLEEEKKKYTAAKQQTDKSLTEDLVNEYLNACRESSDETRIHARSVQYYAFSKMFSITLSVYQLHGNDYNQVFRESVDEPLGKVSFLHSPAQHHIDLLAVDFDV